VGVSDDEFSLLPAGRSDGPLVGAAVEPVTGVGATGQGLGGGPLDLGHAAVDRSVRAPGPVTRTPKKQKRRAGDLVSGGPSG